MNRRGFFNYRGDGTDPSVTNESTSIISAAPRLPVSKPIMPLVKEISRVDSFHEPMKAFGYESSGEYGIEGRIQPIMSIFFSTTIT